MVKEITYKLNVDVQGHTYESFLIRANRKTGIYAEYQFFGDGLVKRRRVGGGPVKDEENGPKKFKIKNSDFGVLPTDKLFEELDKIKYPEEEEFYEKFLADASAWILNVDGKEYYGTAKPDFYLKIMDLLQIDAISKFISKK